MAKKAVPGHNSRVHQIPVKDILPDKNQPRHEFDDESLKELADSIDKHELLQPILVEPDRNNKYKIVAGERRYQAVRMLRHENDLAPKK